MKNTVILSPIGYLFSWEHLGISDEWKSDVLNNVLYPNTKYKWGYINT